MYNNKGKGATKYILFYFHEVHAPSNSKHIMCNNVRIAGPYSMDPYIVFPNVSGEIDNYEPFQPGWIRVGDSVFQGDFTIGTGLGYHFEIIGNSMNKIREFIQNNFRWANVLHVCV